MLSPFSIALLGAYTLVVSHGIGRFLYTASLPSILDQTSVTTLTSGYLASANYAGYLMGAIIAMFIPRTKSIYLLQVGVGLCVTATFALLFEHLTVWYVVRFLAGLGGALILVNGSTLILSQFPSNHRVLYTSIYYSGVGFGVVVSALIVMVVQSTVMTYETMWLVGGVFTLPVIWVAFKFSDLKTTKASLEHHHRAKGVRKTRWLVIVSYGLCGYGYITSATYLPVMIVDGVSDQNTIPNLGMWVWCAVGMAVVLLSPLWGRFAHKFGEITMLCMAIILQILSLLIPIYFMDVTMLMLSAVLFGGSFMAIVSLSMGLVKHLTAHGVNFYLGLATVCYSVGQMIGPIVTVYLHERFGSFTSGIEVSSVVYGLALFILCVTRCVHKNETAT